MVNYPQIFSSNFIYFSYFQSIYLYKYKTSLLIYSMIYSKIHRYILNYFHAMSKKFSTFFQLLPLIIVLLINNKWDIFLLEN